MYVVTLTGNTLRKSEMEYHGKFGHTLGRIQKISVMRKLTFSTHPSAWEPNYGTYYNWFPKFKALHPIYG